MKRTALVLGLSLALAAPVALAAPPGTTTGPAGKPETKPVVPQAKGKAKTLYLVRACVTEGGASAEKVNVKVLSANAHARKNGATRAASPLDLKLADNAKVVLVGKARPNPAPKPKGPVKGSVADLVQGDVITLRVRAARNTTVTTIEFTSVVDNGPIRPKVCEPAPAAS